MPLIGAFLKPSGPEDGGAHATRDSVRHVRDPSRLSVCNFDDLLHDWERAGAAPCVPGKLPAPAPASLAVLAQAWDDEMRREPELEAAARIVRALARGQPAGSLIDDWRRLNGTAAELPAIEQLRDAVTSLAAELPQALASSLMPTLLAPFLSQLQGEVGDIVHGLTHPSRTPVLERSIHAAPCFAQTRHRCEELVPALDKARQVLNDARDDVLSAVQAGDTQGAAAAAALHRAAAETLAAQLGLAARQSQDHAKASGLARLKVAGSAASAAAKALSTGAAWTPARVLAPLGEALQIATRAIDRARGERVIDELNLRFADIVRDDAKDIPATQIRAEHIDAAKLRSLAQAQVVRLVSLACEALEHLERGAGSVAEAKALATARQRLASFGPRGADGYETATRLLTDRKLLLQTVMRARLASDQWARGVGKAYCSKLLGLPAAGLATDVLAPLAHGLVGASAVAANSMALSTLASTSAASRPSTASPDDRQGWLAWGDSQARAFVSAAAALSGGVAQAWHGWQGKAIQTASSEAVAGAHASLGQDLEAAIGEQLLRAIDEAGPSAASPQAEAAAAAVHKLASSSVGAPPHNPPGGLEWRTGADVEAVAACEQSGASVIVLRHSAATVCFAKSRMGEWTVAAGSDRRVVAKPSQVMKALADSRVDLAAFG